MTGVCVAFTEEAFEEALWSTLEASGAPPIIRLKVIGLAVTVGTDYARRSRVAASPVYNGRQRKTVIKLRA